MSLTARRLAGLLGLAGVVVVVLLNRGIWFYGDDWDFFVRRYFEFHDGSRLDALLGPHNEHWATFPVAIHLVLQSVFGLRHRLPYVGVLAIAHGVVIYCVTVLVYKSTYRRVVAVTAGVGITLLSSGFENLVWTFQIGFIGAIALGLVLVLLVDTDETSPKRDITSLAVLCAALATQGTSLTLVVVAAVVMASRRQWARMGRVLTPGLVLFVVWYVSLGREHSQPHPTARQRLDIPTYVWRGVSASLDGVAHVPGIAAALLLAIGIAFCLPRNFSPRFRLPMIMAVGGVFFFALNGWTRVQYGVDQAASSRYLYVGVVLFTPLIAVTVTTLLVDRTRFTPLFAAITVWLTASGLASLENQRGARADSDHTRLSSMLAVVEEHDETVDPSTVFPSPQWDIKLTLADLLLLDQEGMLPRHKIDPTIQLDVRVKYFLNVAEVPDLVSTAHHQVTTEPAVMLTASGGNCLAIGLAPAPVAVNVRTRNRKPFVLVPETNTIAEFSLADSKTLVSSSEKISVELVSGRGYLVSGWGRPRTVRIDIPAGASLTLCGVTQ
jgi:hypothetical protein